MSNFVLPYTPTELNFLQSMTDEGMAASAIAAEAAREFRRPITRNAIISLWHRGRLRHVGRAKGADGGAARKIAEKSDKPKRKYTRSNVSVPGTPILLPRESDIARVSLFDLTNETCRFPVNEGYCGLPEADLLDGKPYCPDHHERCFTRIVRTGNRPKTSVIIGRFA
jgi:hypothetical protein